MKPAKKSMNKKLAKNQTGKSKIVKKVLKKLGVPVVDAPVVETTLAPTMTITPVPVIPYQEGTLVMDPKLKDWTGELPSGCRTVIIEWFNQELGAWETVHLPRAKSEAVSLIESAVERGPNAFALYRLVPASDINDAVAGAVGGQPREHAPKKPKAAKVGDGWRADSEIGRMFTLLSDGNKHTSKDVIETIKPKTGRITNKTKKIQEYGVKTGDYTLVVKKDVLQLTFEKVGTAVAKK